MSEAHNRLHWTVLSNYRLRAISFAIMFVAIAFHGWERHFAPLLWGYIGLHLLVYPHLAYWRSRFSSNSRQSEFNNLAVDCLLWGVLVSSVAFPLWIAFTVYIASTLNSTISWGARGFFQSQMLFAAGVLLSVAVLGFQFSPETDFPTTLVCLCGNVFYMTSIALTAHKRNQQLRATRESLQHSENVLKSQLSEIQALQIKLGEEMEARVEQRTKERVQTQKLASLGALVAGMAHEVNTPVGNAVLVASTLERDLQSFKQKFTGTGLRRRDLDEHTERASAAAAMILESLAQAATLVRNFKRVSVTRASQASVNVHLMKLVEDAVQNHRVTTGSLRIAIENHIAPDVSIRSHPDALVEVLHILLENAQLHGFEGRASGMIRFTVSLTSPEVLQLRVTDDGRGISAEHISKVFDPFFTTRLGRGGNGLGLSVAWNIVTGVLGGNLKVISQLDAGTTFCLDLPIEAPGQGGL